MSASILIVEDELIARQDVRGRSADAGPAAPLQIVA